MKTPLAERSLIELQERRDRGYRRVFECLGCVLALFVFAAIADHGGHLGWALFACLFALEMIAAGVEIWSLIVAIEARAEIKRRLTVDADNL